MSDQRGQQAARVEGSRFKAYNAYSLACVFAPMLLMGQGQATVSDGPLVWIYPERVEESVPSDLLLRLLLLVHLTFLIPHVLAAIIAHQR